MTLFHVQFLLQRHLFEQSFKTCERGLEIFPWPHAYDIWLVYLRTMVARFKGTKTERIRELF